MCMVPVGLVLLEWSLSKVYMSHHYAAHVKLIENKTEYQLQLKNKNKWENFILVLEGFHCPQS